MKYDLSTVKLAPIGRHKFRFGRNKSKLVAKIRRALNEKSAKYWNDEEWELWRKINAGTF